MASGSENVQTTYIKAFEKIGATDLNGTTSNDRMNYFETVPTSALDYTLFLEWDRMGHLLAAQRTVPIPMSPSCSLVSAAFFNAASNHCIVILRRRSLSCQCDPLKRSA
jgi:hypothetical protein